MTISPDLIRTRSEIDLDTGCWNWLGARNNFGYGRMYVDGKDYSAHRLSWVAHHGKVPDGMNVLHHCDNRKCCNPAHLYLGTQSDNMLDMIRRGRRPKKPSGRPIMLTSDQINRIVTSGESAKSLAKEMGIHLATVYRHRIRGTISG